MEFNNARYFRFMGSVLKGLIFVQFLNDNHKRGSVFDHIMDTFGSSGKLDVNRPVFWACMPFLDALSNFRP